MARHLILILIVLRFCFSSGALTAAGVERASVDRGKVLPLALRYRQQALHTLDCNRRACIRNFAEDRLSSPALLAQHQSTFANPLAGADLQYLFMSLQR